MLAPYAAKARSQDPGLNAQDELSGSAVGFRLRDVQMLLAHTSTSKYAWFQACDGMDPLHATGQNLTGQVGPGCGVLEGPDPGMFEYQ